MIVLQLGNFVIHVFVASKINRINFILVDKVQRFQFKVFELGLVTHRFIKVKNALFVGLGTEFLDRGGSGEVLDRVVHEIVDDVLDFEFGGVLEHSVDLLELEGLDIVAVDSGCAIDVVFGADNKSVLVFQSYVLGDFFIGLVFNDEALGHACEQWLVNNGA